MNKIIDEIWQELMEKRGNDLGLRNFKKLNELDSSDWTNKVLPVNFINIAQPLLEDVHNKLSKEIEERQEPLKQEHSKKEEERKRKYEELKTKTDNSKKTIDELKDELNNEKKRVEENSLKKEAAAENISHIRHC